MHKNKKCDDIYYHMHPEKKKKLGGRNQLYGQIISMIDLKISNLMHPIKKKKVAGRNRLNA